MIISHPKAHQAADALGVELEGLTESALKKAFRAKSKDCHPDHHGNDRLAQWASISWARDCLSHWLKQHPVNETPSNSTDVAVAGDCRACSGSGRVPINGGRFGKPLTMQCVMCRGLGTIIPEEHDGD